MEEISTAAELQQEGRKTETWYGDISFEDAKAFIKTNIVSAARSFIAIGYYLKHIRDNELFREEGHATIWDFAQAEYGISKSTASRYMTMNDRFSRNGNSPVVDERYKDFDKSKLQEMLSLTDEQIDQVTPEMRVQDIRGMRASKEIPYFEIEGQLDIKTDFPEVLPDMAGIQLPEVALQQKSQSFELDVSDLLPEHAIAVSQQQTETGAEGQCGSGCCQDCEKQGLETKRTAPTERGCITGQSRYGNCVCCGIGGVECCTQCHEPCNGRCGWIDEEQENQRQEDITTGVTGECHVTDADSGEVKVPEDGDLTDLQIAQQELEKQKRLLNIAISSGFEKEDIHRRRIEIEVAALACFAIELDSIENPPPEPEQPDFPIMRNNEQRKEFLEGFHTWPVWLRNSKASEVYYRYDLPDGNSIVAKEYRYYASWRAEYTDENPHCAGVDWYYLPEEYHYLHDCRTNASYLADKLKELQKKGLRANKNGKTD